MLVASERLFVSSVRFRARLPISCRKPANYGNRVGGALDLAEAPLEIQHACANNLIVSLLEGCRRERRIEGRNSKNRSIYF